MPAHAEAMKPPLACADRPSDWATVVTMELAASACADRPVARQSILAEQLFTPHAVIDRNLYPWKNKFLFTQHAGRPNRSGKNLDDLVFRPLRSGSTLEGKNKDKFLSVYPGTQGSKRFKNSYPHQNGLI